MQAFLIGFDGEVPYDTIQYWLKVSQFTDAVGTKKFKGLADCTLTCLSVPVSNAALRRLFSMFLCKKIKPETE